MITVASTKISHISHRIMEIVFRRWMERWSGWMNVVCEKQENKGTHGDVSRPFKPGL